MNKMCDVNPWQQKPSKKAGRLAGQTHITLMIFHIYWCKLDLLLTYQASPDYDDMEQNKLPGVAETTENNNNKTYLTEQPPISIEQ